MTKKNLIKFLEDTETEYKCTSVSDEIYAFIDFRDLNEFQEILTDDLYSDGGLTVDLQKGCICIDLLDICLYYGISPGDVFKINYPREL